DGSRVVVGDGFAIVLIHSAHWPAILVADPPPAWLDLTNSTPVLENIPNVGAHPAPRNTEGGYAVCVQLRHDGMATVAGGRHCEDLLDGSRAFWDEIELAAPLLDPGRHAVRQHHASLPGCLLLLRPRRTDALALDSALPVAARQLHHH